MHLLKKNFLRKRPTQKRCRPIAQCSIGGLPSPANILLEYNNTCVMRCNAILSFSLLELCGPTTY